jgi:hypothetical protein
MIQAATLLIALVAISGVSEAKIASTPVHHPAAKRLVEINAHVLLSWWVSTHCCSYPVAINSGFVLSSAVVCPMQ